MTALEFIIAALATHRLTTILTEDKISERWRHWYKSHRKQSYFWTCVRCVSVWTGLVVTIGLVWWNNVIAIPFALSESMLMLAHLNVWISGRGKRRIVLDFDATGYSVTSKELSPPQVVHQFRSAADWLERQIQPFDAQKQPQPKHSHANGGRS